MQERRPEEEQQREGREEKDHGSLHHTTGVPGPRSLGGRPRLHAADRQPVEMLAGQREQGREQRQCREHGEADDDGSSDPHRPQDHELEQDETEQAEQHRQAAEEHGAARGGDRDPDGLLDARRLIGRLFGQLLAEATREQERVVDAKTEPEQRREVEDEDAHRCERGDDVDRREGDEDTRSAHHERDSSRDQRAEDQQQGERRERQRDDLAPLEVSLAHLLDIAVEGRPAREFDGQTGRLVQAFAEDREGIGRVVGRQVEQDDVVRGVAIRRDLARLQEMRDDADDVGRRRDVAHRGRSGRLEGRTPAP